jgi:hypothetical protein
MKGFWVGTVALAGLLLMVAVASSQPPSEAKDKGPRNRKDGPPRFELGRVLPPPLVEELNLTREQQAE